MTRWLNDLTTEWANDWKQTTRRSHVNKSYFIQWKCWCHVKTAVRWYTLTLASWQLWKFKPLRDVEQSLQLIRMFSCLLHTWRHDALPTWRLTASIFVESYFTTQNDIMESKFCLDGCVLMKMRKIVQGVGYIYRPFINYALENF